MKSDEFFKEIEKTIPKELALKNDKVGLINNFEDEFEINNVIVEMDYVEGRYDYSEFDLLILHHPPLIKTPIPGYVIHSNWDIVEGGACDALSDALGIKNRKILDLETGIGRIANYDSKRFKDVVNLVYENILPYKNELRTIEHGNNPYINKIAIISGFGLNQKYIKMAHEKGADLLISGDLIHPGAVLANNLKINIMDISHYFSEIPGLYRLADLIKETGVNVKIKGKDLPWKTNQI